MNESAFCVYACKTVLAKQQMKKKIVLFALTCLPLVVAQAQNDSIRSESLPEVVVTADGQIEMPDKAVLLPTSLEKKHSNNALELLDIMETAGLEVSPQTRTISTHAGGEIALCINGMEVLPEDVATLLAKNIKKIEYIRTPSGKYVGKAGIINFITVKYEYGGNVYMSAKEGFGYKMGDYLAFADYTRKGLTLSLTATGDWSRDHSYTEGNEAFTFHDNNQLMRHFSSETSLRKENNQAVRLKLTSMGENHRLSTYISLSRHSIPSSESMMNVQYSGMANNSTNRFVASEEKGLAPTLHANYTLWLPKDQTLDITASASIGKNDYNNHYSETNWQDILTDVTEKNNSISVKAQYYKGWENGLLLSASLTHDHNYYKDVYAGSSVGEQKLMTDVTMGLVQLSGSSKTLYYYVSSGVSNSAVSLNDKQYNYCSPVAFYGENYTINSKHSLSLNGNYTHTLFDPSNKNDMILQTSFFEAVKGNPELKPLKVLGNSFAYNGQIGKSKLSVSYNSNIYFDNILHLYTADNKFIYDTKYNDGTFYGNMLTATYSYSLLKDKLRLSLTAIEEYNMLRGETYDMSRNNFRIKASATYITGDWMLRFNYRTPYKSLDIREPYLISRQPVYEWTARWNHKAWSIEALVSNPFSRYDKQRITMDYGCYDRDTFRYNESDGQKINVTVTYSFGYGKKSQRGDTEINKNINKAIMKVY